MSQPDEAPSVATTRDDTRPGDTPPRDVHGPTWAVALEAFAWFVGALFLRAGLVQWMTFDGLWGQDPWGYLAQAQGILDWTNGGQTPVARWPQGYPLLGVMLHRLGLSLPVAMQGASLLAGAATVPLVWLAGRAWLPTTRAAVPRLAALFVAVAPVHLVWSLCVTSDVSALAWLAAAAWMLGRAGATRHPSAWMVGAGATLAMALITRFAVGSVLPAFLVAILARGRRQSWRSLQVGVLAFVSVLIPQVLLSIQAPTEAVAHPWLIGWRPWYAWQRSFDTIEGVASYAWPQAMFAVFPAIHPGYLGMAGGLLAGVGVMTLLWPQAGVDPSAEQTTAKGQPRDSGETGTAVTTIGRPACALLLTWAGGVTLFFSGVPFQNFRFGLIALLPWALLAALGAARIAAHKRAWAVGLILLTLVIQGVWAERLLTRHLTMVADRTASARTIAALLPRGATVVAFGLTADIAGRSKAQQRLSVVELATTPPEELAKLWPTTKPVFVVVDPGQIRRQWLGKPVAKHLDWLRTHTHLKLIDRSGRWSVWEARR